MAAPTSGLQFVDEDGNSTLPAGISCTIYNADVNGNPTTLVGSAYTTFGGYCAVDVSLAANYVAEFVGAQAPTANQTFSGSSGLTVVTVANYRSPVLSPLSYANAACTLYPIGWAGASELLVGGGLHAVMRGLLGPTASIDSLMQQVQGALRLFSCTGSLIDSWAADYLGSYIVRYDQESDASFMGRVVAALQMPKCTIAALQAIVTAFYAAIATETGEASYQNLTFDGQGGYDTWGGYDMSQGFAPVVPSVSVWDRQSNPTLANLYDVNPNNDDGSFVIQIAWSPPNEDAWYLDHGHVDYESYLIDIGSYTLSDTAPDPRLGALVNFTKAGGTKPLYLTGIVGD